VRGFKESPRTKSQGKLTVKNFTPPKKNKKHERHISKDFRLYKGMHASKDGIM
jgi:hypothetical protein